MEGLGDFKNLSQEVLLRIVLLLPAPDILRLSSCCKRMRDVICDDYLWKQLFESSWKPFGQWLSVQAEIKSKKMSWRTYFLEKDRVDSNWRSGGFAATTYVLNSRAFVRKSGCALKVLPHRGDHLIVIKSRDHRSLFKLAKSGLLMSQPLGPGSTTTGVAGCQFRSMHADVDTGVVATVVDDPAAGHWVLVENLRSPRVFGRLDHGGPNGAPAGHIGCVQAGYGAVVTCCNDGLVRVFSQGTNTLVKSFDLGAATPRSVRFDNQTIVCLANSEEGGKGSKLFLYDTRCKDFSSVVDADGSCLFFRGNEIFVGGESVCRYDTRMMGGYVCAAAPLLTDDLFPNRHSPGSGLERAGSVLLWKRRARAPVEVLDALTLRPLYSLSDVKRRALVSLNVLPDASKMFTLSDDGVVTAWDASQFSRRTWVEEKSGSLFGLLGFSPHSQDIPIRYRSIPSSGQPQGRGIPIALAPGSPDRVI